MMTEEKLFVKHAKSEYIKYAIDQASQYLISKA